MQPFFPVALNLSGRRCIVIGSAGDAEAMEKEAALREAGGDVSRVDPADVREEDLASAFFVISTPQDETFSAKMREYADRHRFLLCCIDQPAYGFVAMAAIAKAGPVRIAFSTTGQAPAIARRLRERMQDAMTGHFVAFIDAIARKKREAQREFPGATGLAQRRARILEAAKGFDAHISFTYPEWFESETRR